MATNPVNRQLLDFQKRVIEFQKSAFDNSFSALVALQDQQEQLVTRLLDQASAVPSEARQALEAWGNSYRKARDDFKSSADKSFELLDQYFDRLKGGAEESEG